MKRLVYTLIGCTVSMGMAFAGPEGFVNVLRDASVDALVAGYGKNNYDLLKKKSFSTDWLATYLQHLDPLTEAEISNHQQLRLIHQNNKAPLDHPFAFQPQSDQDLLNNLAICVPGSDLARRLKDTTGICESNNFYSNTTRTATGMNDYPVDVAFNAHVFLDPKSYPANGKETYAPALDFIRFVSNAAQTPSLPNDIANQTEIKASQLASDNSGKKAIVQYRSMLANQSLALENFYRAYAQRVKNIANGKKNPLTNQFEHQIIPGKDAYVSQHDLEDYLTTFRANSNPSDKEGWHRAMENAMPSTVARETLYVQAEQLRQLFLLRQAIERLNLNLAALQLSQMQMNIHNQAQVQHSQDLQKISDQTPIS